ncbi:DNA repair protein [Novymonas esmeraldas]|uniref:DNA repair protein n=1 Tax=Novymonas esmeraldas TaxID=1808958 RepID=A0AAW0F6E0_9TRYP
MGEATTLPAFGRCADFIAAVSAREMPDNPSVQLCVLSIGFDVEGVIAQLLHERTVAQKGHCRIYCVVVPDRLTPGAMTRFATAIGRHLRRKHAQAPAVVAVEEGTGTKERCAAYQRGAVVVLTSRVLCADLLHRRLAVELVGMAVLALPQSLLGGGRLHDALAPQTAFCAELLLRSGRGTRGGGEAALPPPLILLSDAPLLLQTLVQRHHVGAERFVQQLHVGDVQLFPRFRLELVQHFERIGGGGGERPALVVDRVVAPVAPSVMALDGLLAKIAVETLQELQRLEQQQLHAQYGRAAAAGTTAADDDDDEAQRFRPRARLAAQTTNGHLDYSAHSRGGVAAPRRAASYVRHAWRGTTEQDRKGILFCCIDESTVLSTRFSDLDADLRDAVRRHDPGWRYRLLTESLIDVRRLRRATRGTAYAFLLQLESVLERRLPRRSVYGTGAAPPAALWTLSSHFHDVATVATHRIGTVVYDHSSAAAAAPPRRAVVVVESGSDEEGGGGGGGAEEAVRVPACPTAAAAAVPRVVPNTEEHETDVEVVVKLVESWCRTMLRRAAREGGAEATTHPTLLLLVIGASDVVRYTERLTNTLEAYRRLQLRRFIHVYQLRYGVELDEYAEQQQQQQQRQQRDGAAAALFDVGENDEDASSGSEGEEDDGTARDEVDTAAQQHRPPSSASRGVRRSHAGSPAVMADLGAGALHHALLSQLPPVESTGTDAVEAAPPAAAHVSGAAPLLTLGRVRPGAATLHPLLASSGAAAATRAPRVLVLDAAPLSATELTMLLEGSHEALHVTVSTAPSPPPPPATTATYAPVSGAESAAAVEASDSVGAPLRVERVLLARQHLPLLRQLEMAQDELPAARLAGLRVQLVTTALAEGDFAKAVQAEQLAFEGLAHAKATLTGTLLVDQSSLRETEAALESGLPLGQRRTGQRRGTAVPRLAGASIRGDTTTAAAAAAAPPCLLFDEREFRASLPYDLYRRGMGLVPLTLATADYVLSAEYAVERKSVADFVQSIMSGRIQHQLAALSRRYAHPLCLIEFHRGMPLRLSQYIVYAKLARLAAAYPRVCYIWARSSAHAAGMLVLLKKTVATANVDPADPALTGAAVDPGSAADLGGVAAAAAERETAYYAARVLSRFPGVTPQNAPRVMQLCGSLIGLATISQASLAAVMGDEDAARLHTFLHAPFHERVD